jgi:hypothetical protein
LPEGYKFIYINYEIDTIVILTMIFFYILLSERILTYFVKLIFGGKLNLICAIIFFCQIQPNIFGIGAMFNYLNDRYYDQIYHQVF